MMATESPAERSNEATVTFQAEIAFKVDSQHVEPKPAQVNGCHGKPSTNDIENEHITTVVDNQVNSAEVSISGGSDNEAARSDVSKSKDDGKGHARQASTVKKLMSFKSVNVNKTFLATKGGTPSASPKPVEKLKPPPMVSAAQSTSSTGTRPRLVAKTGSGSAAKLSGANSAKPAGTPDGNAVWNKNRPAPAVESKNMSDEELTRKFGIHMASRIQPEDDKNHSNWADIDDDDEDWAPDTISWTDGTKIAVTSHEEPAPAASNGHSGSFPKGNGIRDKSKSPVTGPVASPSIKSGVLVSGKGLVLKGVAEKPTLVAKPPPPPAPVKSPWGVVPKVDKVSPMAPDLPRGQQPPRLGPKDVPSQKSMTPPPPKEIAADDFSRTPWRDGPGANRELFNSQSGRYEPVADRTDRRGSFRNEGPHGRQPALLQRTADNQGPAEPSAAFQTHRSSEQHASYGRRRGSSNVSGGSGSFLQRSMGAPDGLRARRESVTASDALMSPRNFPPPGQQPGPRNQNNQAYPQHREARPAPVVSEQQPLAETSNGPVPAPVATLEMPTFEKQRQVMLAARQEAMRRRLEEEAREEAARKERIRLKLEQMGPAPESKSAKKAAMDAALRDQPTTTKQIQSRENVPSNPASAMEKQAEEKVSSALEQAEPDCHVQSGENGAPQSRLKQHGGGAESGRLVHGPEWLPTSGKNVWASGHSLGNGTFGANFRHAQTGPGPIGPPNRNGAMSTCQIAAPNAHSISRPAPIGPPRAGASQDQQGHGGTISIAERDIQQKAWARDVQNSDREFNTMLNEQLEAQEKKLKQQGRTIADVQPSIKDTWRPISLDADGRRVEAEQCLTVGAANLWSKRPAEPKPAADLSSQAKANPAAAGNTAAVPPSTSVPPPAGRSRFFPAHDVHKEFSAIRKSPREGSPSPPPPDMVGHPAFDGDVARPHVSLPPSRPVVRLPPAATGLSRQPGSFAWATQVPYKEDAAPRNSSQHSQLASCPTHQAGSGWQTKIDTLLGVNKCMLSPPKPMAVDSTSRSAVEHSGRVSGVTVSFPGTSLSTSEIANDDSSAMSKTMAEMDDVFEGQEMGSLPPVRIPSEVPDLLWSPFPASKTALALPKKLMVMVMSAENADLLAPDYTITVMLPGAKRRRVVTWTNSPASSRIRSNPRSSGGNRSRVSGGNRPPSSRAGRGRDASAPQQKDHNEQGSRAAGPSGPSRTKWSHPRHRGEGSSWRNPSATAGAVS